MNSLVIAALIVMTLVPVLSGWRWARRERVVPDFVAFLVITVLLGAAMVCIGLTDAKRLPEYCRPVGGGVLIVVGLALALIGATGASVPFEEALMRRNEAWNLERPLVQVFGKAYFRAKAALVGGMFIMLGIRTIIRWSLSPVLTMP